MPTGAQLLESADTGYAGDLGFPTPAPGPARALIEDELEQRSPCSGYACPTVGLGRSPISIPVVIRFVGPFDGYVDVVRLLLRQLGELHAELLEMQTGDLFIELLGEHVDLGLVGVTVDPELDLGQDLVREGG